MQLNTTLSARQVQTMVLAPRMIQSMEILQLPIMALQERIQEELEENPVLEIADNAEEAVNPEESNLELESPAVEESSDPGDAELVLDGGENGELDFDRLEALSKDWDDHFNEEHRPSRNSVEEEGDKKYDAMQNLASRPQSLQDYLADQLAFLDTTAEQAALARYLIANLDANGRLNGSVDELAAAYGQAVTIAQVEEALHLIQRLDPPGVGARTPEECLLLQITPETPHREIVRVLIQNHLEDIKQNRMPAIHKKTGFDLNAIKEAIEVLHHLNPWPGSQFTADNIPYVVPDIVVERNDEGNYDVRLLDDWLPSLYISRRYIDLYRQKGSDPKTKEYLKRKIQSAQWLQESIEQRRNTLIKVTKAIIAHQLDFLEKGPEHINPLKMQQIADQVGVHVTTVSRAVDEKWVQTPRGIFPLKRFFGGGTHTTTGEEVAWETIKNKLLELIDREDKSNPLSDEDLVEQLIAAGYPVARRTVTKYRKMLHIPSSRQRKDWTA